METKILIIDDEMATGIMIKNRLRHRGFQSHYISNVAHYMDEINRLKPELILLDLVMPEISGIDVLKTIRLSYSMNQIPVIIVTSKSEDESLVECLNLGANDFLTKPLNIDVAIARIQAQLDFVQLAQDSMRKKELEAIQSMIVTISHEINNPLAIAIGSIDLEIRKGNDSSLLDKTKNALQRISEIVKQLNNLTESNLKYTNYVDQTKMVELQKNQNKCES